jgi:hypothetical protein
MNSHLHISAVFDEPEFIQTLVERLAYKRYDIGYGSQKMPVGFTALETSSAETYVTGAIVLQFDDNEERFNMPFITCFKIKANSTSLSGAVP